MKAKLIVAAETFGAMFVTALIQGLSTGNALEVVQHPAKAWPVIMAAGAIAFRALLKNSPMLDGVLKDPRVVDAIKTAQNGAK